MSEVRMNDHDRDLMSAILTAWPGARVKPIGAIGMNPTPQEITAMLAASPAGGEYLERLGKTDLAVMTEDEWLGFIEVIVRAFQDSMAQSHAPFAVNRSIDDPFVANGANGASRPTGPITEDELTH